MYIHTRVALSLGKKKDSYNAVQQKCEMGASNL